MQPKQCQHANYQCQLHSCTHSVPGGWIIASGAIRGASYTLSRALFDPTHSHSTTLDGMNWYTHMYPIHAPSTCTRAYYASLSVTPNSSCEQLSCLLDTASTHCNIPHRQQEMPWARKQHDGPVIRSNTHLAAQQANHGTDLVRTGTVSCQTPFLLHPTPMIG